MPLTMPKHKRDLRTEIDPDAQFERLIRSMERICEGLENVLGAVQAVTYGDHDRGFYVRTKSE